jgi:hypothetical protein
MLEKCPSCGVQYTKKALNMFKTTVAAGFTINLICGNCGAAMVVDESQVGSGEVPTRKPRIPKADANAWYILPKGDKKCGPFSTEQLLTHCSQNEFLPGLRIRKGADEDWCAWDNAETTYPELASAGVFRAARFCSAPEEPPIPEIPCAKCGKLVSEKIARKNQGRCKNCAQQRCFIATACYGSSDCPQVNVLRRYRDEEMLTNIIGRILVAIYYAVSPNGGQLKDSSVAYIFNNQYDTNHASFLLFVNKLSFF